MEWQRISTERFKDGNWVYVEELRCPKCGFMHYFFDGHTSQYNYCPQCGELLVNKEESK